jgi:hypothetical protein
MVNTTLVRENIIRLFQSVIKSGSWVLDHSGEGAMITLRG